MSLSLLTLIVKWNSLNLVVLCKINNQGRWSWRGLKWNVWSWRGLKWNVFSLSIYLYLQVFHYLMSLLTVFMLIFEHGINISDIQNLMYFIICLILVYLEIQSHYLLMLFNLSVTLADLAKVKLCHFPLTH
jgi:hypothetical protein